MGKARVWDCISEFWIDGICMGITAWGLGNRLGFRLPIRAGAEDVQLQIRALSMFRHGDVRLEA